MTTLLIFSLVALFVLLALGYFFYKSLLIQRFNRYLDLEVTLLSDPESKKDQIVRGSLLLQLVGCRGGIKGFLLTKVRFSHSEFHLRNFDKLYLDGTAKGRQLSVAFYVSRKYWESLQNKEVHVDFFGAAIKTDNSKSSACARKRLKIS